MKSLNTIPLILRTLVSTATGIDISDVRNMYTLKGTTMGRFVDGKLMPFNQEDNWCVFAIKENSASKSFTELEDVMIMQYSFETDFNFVGCNSRLLTMKFLSLLQSEEIQNYLTTNELSLINSDVDSIFSTELVNEEYFERRLVTLKFNVTLEIDLIKSKIPAEQLGELIIKDLTKREV